MGNSPIFSICIVRNVVWMGSEDGYIHFYDADSRCPLAQTCVDSQCPVLGILHDQNTKFVYILLEIGIVYAVNDDISTKLTNSVLIKLDIKGMYQADYTMTSAFAIVRNTSSPHEVWIGKTNGITVLNAEDLKIISKLKVTKEHSSCIAHIAVAYMESNMDPTCDGTTVNSVFSAFYQGQVITHWDSKAKKMVDMLNMNDFVKGRVHTCTLYINNDVIFCR